MAIYWHTFTSAQVMDHLETNAKGLSSEEAAGRLSTYGPNALSTGKKRKVAEMILSQFRDVMILILLLASVLSFFIGDITDTIVILLIVVANALIGFFQEFRAEKAMDALKRMSVYNAGVWRDGKLHFMPSTQIVPGDLVLLEAGNVVPADLRLVESMNLRIDEAALTGESESVHKSVDPIAKVDLLVGDRKNMALKGTFVTYGRAKGVAVATGMHTELGRIAGMLNEQIIQTPLQQRMTGFGKRLSVIVIFLCIIFFLAGWLRGEEVMKMVLTSISLAVAAIPEALPAVITISLALAAKRMIRVNCLIRKLPAVETLGSVSYICTDKTGTLTRNKMRLESLWANGTLFHQNILSEIRNDPKMHLFISAMALNNDAIRDNEGAMKGDSTEIAILEAAERMTETPVKWERLSEIAFDADRKLMTTFHRTDDNRIISFTKGAPDVLISRCIGFEGDLMMDIVDSLASGGQRVIGFAFRYWDFLPDNPEDPIHEHHLHFLGLAGILDPPREEIPEAVANCKTAGIVPVMITGDHPLTARNIAERIGILGDPSDRLVTGQELAKMDDNALLEVVEKIKVYARVSPEQKLRIIKALQARGHFVAMTGDGINDAPSLKRADIGIAMGITGTDVAKEAADMILLDDNFSTIVKAVKEGRRIYDNILKFIKYLMTSNSGELWTLLLGPFIGLPVALLPIHILWINLVSDGLPAISLSFEKAEKDIMRRPPRPPQESVFSNGRGLHMVWVGMLMGGIVLLMQAWAIREGLHWQTIVFNVLCLCQMGHVLAVRSQTESFFSRHIFSNKPLIGSVLLAFLLQFVVTYLPAFHKIFHTQSLSLGEFFLVGLASSIIFWVIEAGKIVSRKKTSHRRIIPI